MNLARLGCLVVGHAPWPRRLDETTMQRVCTQCGTVFRTWYYKRTPLHIRPAPRIAVDTGLAPVLGSDTSDRTGFEPMLAL